ncbi:MAG: NGG1p interacting factor NIF3 [Candidatus Omnitrophota bacterium]|nr:NGG1p interacting factor NIF3 [Candidatus Omnitrophota bacterium]
MKLGKIYEFLISCGKEVDPRPKAQLKRQMEQLKKDYQELKEDEKKFFDVESLNNPYADSRILYGDRETEVKKIFVGIDIEVGEILLADRLKSAGKKIDLIISHHPEGYALAGLHEVMGVHVDVLVQAGVPVNVAEGLMSERIKEVERKLSAANHMQSVDAARLLGIPFMSMHTAADNHAYHFVHKLVNDKKPQTLGEVVKLLLQVPEYKKAAQNKTGPKILIGNSKAQAGRILVDMTGGTEGSKEIFSRLANVGVGTIICMHLSEEHFVKVKDQHINVIIAGHIASDNVGLNLLLDKLEKQGKFEIITCSGFERVKR